MAIGETARAAVELAGEVKGRLVEFALSPPFERHLRRIAREVAHAHPDSQDLGVMVVERLLFNFRYDDGTTVVDRFVRRPRIGDAERVMALGFLDGVDGFFEVLAEATEQAVDAHDRFIAAQGSDQLLVAGRDLAGIYADAIVPAGADAQGAEASRAVVRRTIEESELAAADDVLVYSHPRGGGRVLSGLQRRRAGAGVRRGRRAGRPGPVARLPG